MIMRYCEDVYCETPEEPIDRASDYRIVDGAVICTHCYEREQDAREEEEANRLDFD
jgi:hypothetical protein